MKTKTMTLDDVAPAVSLALDAGWSNLARQYAFFVEHPQCLALVAEEGDEVLGTGFGARHGAVGWIGFIVVSKRYREQGIGTTELGRPVYERLGFRIETCYRQFGRSGRASLQDYVPPGLHPLEPEDLDAVCDLDLRMTGEDRSHLIQAFSNSGRVLEDEVFGSIRAYHVAVPWGNGSIVAADPEAGWLMLRDSLRSAGRNGDIAAWLTDENVVGQDTLQRAEFTESRRIPRMVFGEPLHWHPPAIWGLFSLAEG